jgi:hypothetical protein
MADFKIGSIFFKDIIIIALSVISIIFAFCHNSREEKLFKAKIEPILQVNPIDEEFQLSGPAPDTQYFGTTHFIIYNYSGFDAYNIESDVKYHGPWIRQWMKAEVERLKKVKIERNITSEEQKSMDRYQATTKKIIKILRSGESSKHEWTGGFYSGDPDCEKGKYDIWIRINWENADKRRFENVQHYILQCTKSGNGISYTFFSKEKIN